jgi:hypothetical protein
MDHSQFCMQVFSSTLEIAACNSGFVRTRAMSLLKSQQDNFCSLVFFTDLLISQDIRDGYGQLSSKTAFIKLTFIVLVLIEC